MAISRNRRDNKSGRGSPEPTWLDAVAVEAITKNQIVYVDSLPVTGASFSTTSIGQDVVRKVGVATNATRKKAVNSLYIALTSAAAVGDKLKIAPIGLLNNLDTSGGAAGDPVYLSTAGLPTLAATAGFTRRIGEVVGVGVSGTGTWNFARRPDGPGGEDPAARNGGGLRGLGDRDRPVRDRRVHHRLPGVRHVRHGVRRHHRDRLHLVREQPGDHVQRVLHRQRELPDLGLTHAAQPIVEARLLGLRD